MKYGLISNSISNFKCYHERNYGAYGGGAEKKIHGNNFKNMFMTTI